ncbi:disease resistance protein RPM1-like isoform X2 [Nymphaea colorata]|uniref:disease resistance protein RPM1-like isoform X2 n=1 Tax=Nymphaea colorata TaxID=210225 RepID=UPI00129DD053|nr:disease resistance protein RPM1-like isoform X2 [Nymphaea colorata]
MAESIVSFLLEKLNGLVLSQVLLLAGVSQEIEDIREELASMQAFLKDADRRKDKEEGVKEWVKQVRHTTCDLEDIIDRFMLRFGRQSERGFRAFLWNVSNSIKHLQSRHNLANEIQTIRKRISDISRRRDMYLFDRTAEATISSIVAARHHDDPQTREVPFTDDVDVMGFDNEIESLVKELTKENESEAEFPKLKSMLVVGMGGSGKTTLARKVYNDAEVKKHFDSFAWVSVSQSFHSDDLLRRLLKCFFKERKEMGEDRVGEMDAEELGEKLFNYLQGRRYIIVLDDVWSRTVWDAIKFALPKNSKGSTIMITTRIRDITFALEADGLTCFLHQLNPLPAETAMELFCRKAFKWTRDDKACPHELRKLCKNLVEKSEGLPLAIVSLGSLMSTKQRTEPVWRKACDDLRYQLSSNPSLEGLVKGRASLSAEEVGADWLQELINRNLLQVVATNHDGKVGKCSLHDLVRELAISQAESEDLCAILERAASTPNRRCRHLSIQSIGEDILPSKVDSRCLHSLFVFDDTIKQPCLLRMLSGLQLVRALDLQGTKIQELPSKVGELFHLRYLNLSGTMVQRLPKSFSNLVNLQVLDIRGTPIEALTKEIVKMTNLRHLYMTERYNEHMSKQVSHGLGNLSCLQTLVGLAGNKRKTIRDLTSLTNLRKLEIYQVGKEDMDELCASIRKMNHLFSLLIHSPKSLELDPLLLTPPPQLRLLRLCGQLERMPSVTASLVNISLLTLVKCRLRDDPFPCLWSLPNLQWLNLSGAYEGRELRCRAQAFPKLVFLFLSRLGSLETVILEEGSMPNLKTLGIHGCLKLERVPQGIHQLRNLQELDITEMPPKFLERLKKDGGEDRPLVEHVPKLLLLRYNDKEGYQRLGFF